jgi:hypothetical protein
MAYDDPASIQHDEARQEFLGFMIALSPARRGAWRVMRLTERSRPVRVS